MKKGEVRRIHPDAAQCRALLAKAEADLKAAEDNLKAGHYNWALAIAYNAMLTAGLALMAFKGYRASSDSHHLAVVKFCASILPAETTPLTNAFNHYRVRRHDVVYGEAGSVAPSEARKAVEKARELVSIIQDKTR
ncbi:hypothetical protein AUJ15_01430 [Candidatus Micrarchaeota archaeon CG1_02_55_41]|nr:MAG: hypothetical protein AUJ15_01430 [Candidatus Micrarchaeota archaeon CG1_02_55_41]